MNYKDSPIKKSTMSYNNIAQNISPLPDINPKKDKYGTDRFNDTDDNVNPINTLDQDIKVDDYSPISKNNIEDAQYSTNPRT